MDPQTPISHSHLRTSSASRRPPDSPLAATSSCSPHASSPRNTILKLGDFTRIHDSARSTDLEKTTISSPPPSPFLPTLFDALSHLSDDSTEKSAHTTTDVKARLGNFSKVFNQLGTSNTSTKPLSSVDTTPKKAPYISPSEDQSQMVLPIPESMYYTRYAQYAHMQPYQYGQPMQYLYTPPGNGKTCTFNPVFEIGRAHV